MHVCFSSAARSSALHAFVVVALEHGLAYVPQSGDPGRADDESDIIAIGTPTKFCLDVSANPMPIP